MIERWKRKNMENLLELHNKTPVWNDGVFFFLYYLCIFDIFKCAVIQSGILAVH